MSFFTPIRNRITKAKTVPKDVTPEEVLAFVNSAPETFSSMDLRILNNRFHIADADGKKYRFTKAGGGELTLVPASAAYRQERNSTRELAEAIERIEAQLKELEFLSDRFREMQGDIMELQKKVGIEHKASIETVLRGATTTTGGRWPANTSDVVRLHKSGALGEALSRT